MSALINFLKDEMRARGWTQRDLEIESGVPDSTLSRLLQGKVEEPKPSVLYKIAHALGVPFRQLMGLAGFPYEDSRTEDEQLQHLLVLRDSFPWLPAAVDDIARLGTEEREVVLQLLETLRNRQS